MREEPVIYVNGRPYVVRDADAPFRNIDYTGIDTIHIELIEQRLKLDILREARTFQGRILLHGMAAITRSHMLTLTRPAFVHSRLKCVGSRLRSIRQMKWHLVLSQSGSRSMTARS